MEKAVAAYMGAKCRLAPALCAAMVYKKAKRSKDLFGGAGNTIVQKPSHEIEIYNDIDPDLCCLFRQLSYRNNHKEILNYIFSYSYSFEMHERIRNIVLNDFDKTGMSENQYASYVWYLLLSSKNGDKHGKFRGINSQINEEKFKNSILGKINILERLVGIQVTNRSAIDILNEEIAMPELSADTMYFLDSPYLNNKARYPHNMTSRSEHEEYCELVGQLGGYRMVCGYDNEDYREVYDKILVEKFGFYKYFVADVAKTMAIGNGGKMKPREDECIWTSYQIKGAYEL